MAQLSLCFLCDTNWADLFGHEAVVPDLVRDPSFVTR